MLYAIVGIVGVIIGIIIGFVWSRLIQSKHIYGTLLVTKSDDGGLPYLSLDMDEYPYKIEQEDYVIFRTKVIDPNSHE